MMAIGVGDEIYPPELEGIASSNFLVQRVGSYNTLQTITDDLREIACNPPKGSTQ